MKVKISNHDSVGVLSFALKESRSHNYLFKKYPVNQESATFEALFGILKSCENKKYGKWWWRILFLDAEEASAINKISNGRERIILFQAAIRKNCVNWTDRLNCNRSQGTRWCLSSDFEKVQSESFFFAQLSGRGVKFFTGKWRDIKSVNNSPAAI